MKTKITKPWEKKDSITMSLYKLMSFDKENKPYIKTIKNDRSNNSPKGNQ